MKLARFSVAPAILFGLCLGLAGACGTKKPPGTNPPGEDGGGGGGGGGTSDGGGTGDGGSGGAVTDGGGDGGDGGAAAPTSCDAKVAEAPTLIFNGLVMLRPPTGVDFPPDDNPMVQTAAMSGGFVSACDASVKRVMVFSYEADKKKKLGKLVDEFIDTLKGQGYSGGTKSSAYVDSATDFHVSVEYGGSGGGEAVVLYLAGARRGTSDFIAVYETTPEDFKLLKPTFEESAKTILLVPQ